MDPFDSSSSQIALAELVHNLRQPINNIGLCASYLSLLLGDGPGRAQDQLLMIQEQVERSARMLDEAAIELRRVRAEPKPEMSVAEAQSAGAS